MKRWSLVAITTVGVFLAGLIFRTLTGSDTAWLDAGGTAAIFGAGLLIGTTVAGRLDREASDAKSRGRPD